MLRLITLMWLILIPTITSTTDEEVLELIETEIEREININAVKELRRETDSTWYPWDWVNLKFEENKLLRKISIPCQELESKSLVLYKYGLKSWIPYVFVKDLNTLDQFNGVCGESALKSYELIQKTKSISIRADLLTSLLKRHKVFRRSSKDL